MIRVTAHAWQMIRAALHFRPNMEVQFFGKTLLEDGDIYVTDILVPPQLVGAGHTDLDVDRGDLDWLWEQIVAKGDTPADWRFWGHSHGAGGVFASGTDKETMLILAKMFGGWACGAVFNSKNEVKAWGAAQEYQFPNRILTGKFAELPNLDITIEPYIDLETEALVHTWMRENVQEPPKNQFIHVKGKEISVAANVNLNGLGLIHDKNGTGLWYTVRELLDADPNSALGQKAKQLLTPQALKSVRRKQNNRLKNERRMEAPPTTFERPNVRPMYSSGNPLIDAELRPILAYAEENGFAMLSDAEFLLLLDTGMIELASNNPNPTPNTSSVLANVGLHTGTDYVAGAQGALEGVQG